MVVRRLVALVALVAVGALAAGCTSSSSGHARHLGDVQIAGSPTALIGSWKVSAAGEPRGTSLILANDLRVFRRCGMLDGAWSADQYGDFVAETWGGSGSCFQGAHPSPNVVWLSSAISFRIDGVDRVMLGRDGQVVARLSPGARPAPGPDILPTLASPPVADASMTARLAEPAPLPAGVQAATSSDVIGRWRAVGRTAGNPKGFVEFDMGGRWTGSDGCNGWGGRYRVGLFGELIAISGPTTLVGCNGSPAPGWVGQARRIGLDGGDLVLFDRAGKKIGVLTKASS